MSDIEKKELSFAESYRSQILHPEEDEEDESPKNLIIIFVLIVVVLALGIFGYNYLSKDNQTESGDKVKEKLIKEEPIKEEETITPPESIMLNNINDLMNEEEEKESNSSDIKVEEKKVNKKKAKVTYLEQLAELSKEIDGEK